MTGMTAGAVTSTDAIGTTTTAEEEAEILAMTAAATTTEGGIMIANMTVDATMTGTTTAAAIDAEEEEATPAGMITMTAAVCAEVPRPREVVSGSALVHGRNQGSSKLMIQDLLMNC